MKKICLAAVFGAAFLAIGGFANAQGTGSSSSGTALNKCWDQSSDVVRDRSGTDHWKSQDRPAGMNDC
jgi:hypothetical protein